MPLLLQEDFSSFFTTARQLGIRGLTENDSDTPAPLPKSKEPSSGESMRHSTVTHREKIDRRFTGRITKNCADYTQSFKLKQIVILDSPPLKCFKNTSIYPKSYPTPSERSSDNIGYGVRTGTHGQQTRSSKNYL